MTTDHLADGIRFSWIDQDAIVPVTPYDMQSFDHDLQHSFFNSSLLPEDKLIKAATLFLNCPYLLEPLGEGIHAEYSQEPLYRTDKFDCVSYVNTVLSLTNASDLSTFKKQIQKIRYQNSNIHYINRTDWFTDLEWLPNVIKLKWLKEATHIIVDKDNRPIQSVTTTTIDKPNWYRVRPLKSMHLLMPLIDKAAQQLQGKLQSHAEQFQAEVSTLTYLPLDKLFNLQGEAQSYFFNQIPQRAVIIVVRPNWPIRDKFPGFPQGYGTNLNVSHLGIAIKSNEDILFYHASSLKRQVVCEPLINYLQTFIQSPTVKGIHIAEIV